MALAMIWSALAAMAMFLILEAPILPLRAMLYTRFALLASVPILGILGIVFSSIGLYRAGRLSGYRRGVALGALIGSCFITILGIPVCLAITNLIYALRFG
ncbi:hypothetical protein [Paramicrobacterium agarici]|uniref:hypothetical protein n=1 Tax=Paramicrobacterium agarici TaxID=630514 RepID=UPI001150B73B|nr:hypothetical protein [Microbacterium agarici]TQO24284.1 hypothetical protein FB385_3164 [Microbacterium agarici]